MLSLKSFYRSIQDRGVQYESTKSSRQEYLTPGICDYIPQSYFLRQLFSIYIEGIDINQIIQSILWNQFYQKTLLKEIYSQISLSQVKSQSNGLLSKLDTMMSKVTNNETIYLKIQNKVYNLKDKLQYQSHEEMEKQLKKCKCLIIQKITHEGKWKKINIQFGPYKNKEQFDIIFEYDSFKDSLKNNKQIEKESKTNERNTLSAQKSSNIQSKNQSSRKCTKSLINSTSKKNQQKQNHLQSKSKSNFKQNLDQQRIESSKKQIKQSFTKSQRRDSTESNNKSIQNSLKKSLPNVFECTASDMKILKQLNFNSTAKLSNQCSHIEQQIVPVSLDLKRKQKLKVKQNSILEGENVFDWQALKNNSQQLKNNSILSQILSKKEEIIFSQKKRIQQIQQKYQRQIQDLKIKHLKETENFKTQIKQILNEYSKKYDAQKQESKQLRTQLAAIQKILTENKVLIAQLQIKSKSNQDQSLRYKNQVQQLKQKLGQIEEKHTQFQVKSKQQNTSLISQRNNYQKQMQKYTQKYNTLLNKFKLALQDQNHAQ